jgi:hypothetical protein
LQSWKEIAAFLGVSVRTAQQWEKQAGLPVRRTPGIKGRVWADAAELSIWKTTIPASAPSSPMPSSHRWRWIALAVGGLALAGLGWTAWLRGAANPVDARVESRSLVALDGAGQELWRHTFPDDLWAEAYHGTAPPAGRPVWIGDLDGDGASEVLFLVVSNGGQWKGPLYCFSARGELRWRYSPQRTVSTRLEVFPPPYVVDNFVILDRAGDRKVVVTSLHGIYYACQVALLAADGKPEREYWHSGHLRSLLIVRGLDGRPLILAGGISNAEKRATFVALDPERMGGASRETNPDYQFAGFPTGLETARILFGRSRLNRRDLEYNSAGRLSQAGTEIVVHVVEKFQEPRPVLIYHFGPDLSLRRLVASDHMASQTRIAGWPWDAVQAAELEAAVEIRRD